MRWSVILLVASLAACNDPTSVREIEVVAKSHSSGGYHLQTWNGQSLPAVLASGNGTITKTEILGADLTLSLTLGWEISWNYRLTWGVADSVTTVRSVGRGSLSNGFMSMGNGGATVTISGTTATVRCCATGPGSPVGGEVYVFQQ